MSKLPHILRGASPLGFCAVIATLILATALPGCKDEPQAAEPVRLVAAIKLVDASGLIEGELPGRASADQEVELAFRVTGRLTEYPMKVGQRVTRGQLLAQLDRRDFQNAVQEIEGDLARARADVDVTRSDYERALSIKAENPGAISQAVIDKRHGALKQAQADVISTQARLEDAQHDLNDTSLAAPFDAIVVATYVNNFEEVLSKQPVMRLVDPTKIEVAVQVPEQHIMEVPLVDTIRCRFDAFPGIEIPATVHEIGAEASSDTRTYPVTLILSQPEDVVILPGMAATVKASFDATTMGDAGRLIVPVAAVFANEKDQAYVWLVDTDTSLVRRHPVTVRMPMPSGLSVDGLESGDWVVTAGVHFLTEGQRVRLPKTEGGAS